MIYQSTSELENDLKDILSHRDEDLKIINVEKLKEYGIDHLIYAGVLSDDAQTRHLARVLIRKIAPQLGVLNSSIYPLYEAFGESKVMGFTVPAMNMRTMTYDVARVIFKKAIEMEAGAFIFEISRSEMVYTKQNQDEIVVCVMAAAVKEGFEGPIFLQGDHYQFNKDKYKEYPKGQIDEIQLEIKNALMYGFYNIDIDASTLVDLEKESEAEQQTDNIEMTSLMTKYIRQYQPSGVLVTMGGEIGHIGGVNSTVDDFEAFMSGYKSKIGENTPGISKVSVQTGTSHGGTPNSDGSLKTPDVDFSVLENIGKIAREKYKMAGAVQHGASTLPDEMFDKFPQAGTVEIHLATGIQNVIFDTMPSHLRDKMYEYVISNLQDEREDGWSDEQFIYKLRKKAFGKFKKDLWLISENDKEIIRKALGSKIETWFEKLNLKGTRHTVREYIG